MNDLFEETIKRIDNMDIDHFHTIIDRLSFYGVNFYNKNGFFNFNKFKNDCIETSNLLYKNDIPHPVTNIRYQLCDFLSLVQTIVGIRNYNEFMKTKLDDILEEIRKY